MSRGPSWMRVAAEGVVIVGSILLAFGIDAAWDGREQKHRSEALLAAIAGDMARARAEVDRVASFHRTGQSAAADLLNLGGAGPRYEEQAHLVDSLVAASYGSTASYDARLGAVESLFGAGGLDLVTDPDLAFELTAFPALVADLAREQILLQSMATELHAYLANQGVDTSLFDLNAFDVPWKTGPTGVVRLIETPRFRSIVSMIWYRYSNTTGSLGAMRESVTRIESLLPGS